jgi:hypothetical protein
MQARWSLVLSVVAAACGHPARPTVTGADLYAQVHTLQDTGVASIGSIAVRKGQVLTTGTQTFVVEQVIDKCHGGDPANDVDCALALLLDQRFTVMDRAPAGHARGGDHEDQSRSMISSVVIIGLGVAAVGGLIYGIAACDFPGCKYVFGVPLVFIGAGALFMVSRD